MLPKKTKAVVASILTAAMTTNVIAATVVPASAARTKSPTDRQTAICQRTTVVPDPSVYLTTQEKN